LGGITTAFCAEAGSGAPIIGYLGEYDALAGLSQKNQPTQEPVVEGGPGHGCGHNLLGTGGLASAVAVARWLNATGTSGTVRYYGCPAEEQISGKAFMARTGSFDDLDAAFNFHPANVNAPSKGTCVGVNDLVFRFHGRTAHAGGAPHEGRSALDAVELMNVGVNYLREHVTDKVRIHYVITDGGKLPNVVPDTAEVWYFVRALERAEIEEVSERVRNCARGAALMTDTTVEMRVRGACSRVLNNAHLADLQYEAMQLVGPIEFTAEEKAYAAQVNAAFPARNADEMFAGWQTPAEEQPRLERLAGEPLIGDNFPAWDANWVGTGSTDVGDVSWITPLSMLRTACWATGAPGHSWGIVATGATSIGHKGMMHSAKVMAVAALDLYLHPEHLRDAQAELAAATNGTPYVCPIPADVDPPTRPHPLR
jgi:aminobenzoyl-glutamate utilization protein B